MDQIVGIGICGCSAVYRGMFDQKRFAMPFRYNGRRSFRLVERVIPEDGNDRDQTLLEAGCLFFLDVHPMVLRRWLYGYLVRLELVVIEPTPNGGEKVHRVIIPKFSSPAPLLDSMMAWKLWLRFRPVSPEKVMRGMKKLLNNLDSQNGQLDRVLGWMSLKTEASVEGVCRV